MRALIDVIASQVAVLEEDIDGLYDDQFIETCAPWVAPYIGDLIGYHTLYGLTDKIGSPRAEVANTIAFRRRKGTASMLEQLARDVTGWDARAVEFFQLLATTQYMNHIRPQNVVWVNMRDHARLATIATPFDTAAHTADVRRIARRRGRFNIPNVGIYLWRIKDYELSNSPGRQSSIRRRPIGATCSVPSERTRRCSTTRSPKTRSPTSPIGRTSRSRSRVASCGTDVDAFYPSSIALRFGNTPVPASAVAASDLSDLGAGWAYTTNDEILIDPVLGRLALPPALTIDGNAVDLEQPGRQLPLRFLDRHGWRLV